MTGNAIDNIRDRNPGVEYLERLARKRRGRPKPERIEFYRAVEWEARRLLRGYGEAEVFLAHIMNLLDL